MPIKARYENGVFRPLEKVRAEEGKIHHIGMAAWVLLGSAFLLSACSSSSPTPVSTGRYSAVIAELERDIRQEMEDKNLPSFAIALVDDQEIVWNAEFSKPPAVDQPIALNPSSGAFYRVGSVSKLFTDLAVMQLVEQGKLDLDAPVTQYLPDFAPRNPFSGQITLRQLMSHHSGLVREPPIGNYFDTSGPSLADTVASLNQTELIYPPESRTKYSNAGIAVVGYVLENLQRRPFAEYLEETLLRPLGLTESTFRLTSPVSSRLSDGWMWTYDGRQFKAPVFDLGMAPAGNMYATVQEMARFMSVLFQGGRSGDLQLLKPETLETMWTPQFSDQPTGFGLGFAVSELENQRMVSHSGAVYGFATQLSLLPRIKLGVVTITGLDGANAVTARIANSALKMLLATHEDRPLPEPEMRTAILPELAERLRGSYEREADSAEFLRQQGRLLLEHGGLRVAVRADENGLVTDGRLLFGTRINATDSGVEIGGVLFRRVDPSKPAPATDRWKGLIGEYGWDHNTLYILEKKGRLYALIEWFFFYPLKELSPSVFAFPDYGLYQGEKLVFARDESGPATQVEAAGVVFPRRPTGAQEGSTFRIQPLHPVEELRERALKATPPPPGPEEREPDLVDLTTLDPSIRLDIRYATTNNFMGAVFYNQPRAFLQRPAAEALLRAHRWLLDQGYGLLIHDAYRPWYVTRMFWDATPPDLRIFVADPSRGSRHNRGAAVDLTLYDLSTGNPVEMVGGYDEFSARSYPDYPGGTSLQRWHRELLRQAMEAQGFQVYEFEWWHFDYRDWARYPVLNLSFEELTSESRQD